MVGLAPKWVRLAQNGTIPELFQIRFQFIYWNLIWKSPVLICLICGQSAPLWSQTWHRCHRAWRATCWLLTGRYNPPLPVHPPPSLPPPSSQVLCPRLKLNRAINSHRGNLLGPHLTVSLFCAVITFHWELILGCDYISNWTLITVHRELILGCGLISQWAHFLSCDLISSGNYFEQWFKFNVSLFWLHNMTLSLFWAVVWFHSELIFWAVITFHRELILAVI